MKKTFLLLGLLLSVLIPSIAQETRIKMATTTSTENSGLLNVLLPEFTKKTGIQVDVIAVGTGKAIKLGENGDVDVILVHSRKDEDRFVADGFGVNRKDVMYNDFIVLGPKNESHIKKKKNILDVFKLIYSKNLIFISRGDDSGTHKKELEIWQSSGIKPDFKNYREAGQGMEQVIMMANEQKGYTLADRGTWLAVMGKTTLTITFENDPLLFNPYGIIAVNPEKYKHIKYKEAAMLIDWIVSPEGQKLICEYKINGKVLFFPNAAK